MRYSNPVKAAAMGKNRNHRRHLRTNEIEHDGQEQDGSRIEADHPDAGEYIDRRQDNPQDDRAVVRRGQEGDDRTAPLNRRGPCPLFTIDRTIRITAKRMRSNPISPGKIPGLSMNSPRMGSVKESQQTASPRKKVNHPTRRSRSIDVMVLHS